MRIVCCWVYFAVVIGGFEFSPNAPEAPVYSLSETAELLPNVTFEYNRSACPERKHWLESMIHYIAPSRAVLPTTSLQLDLPFN